MDLRIWHKPMATARQTFPHMSIRGKAIPVGDGVMADSRNTLRMNSNSGRDDRTQRQVALNYSLKGNLSVFCC